MVVGEANEGSVVGGDVGVVNAVTIGLSESLVPIVVDGMLEGLRLELRFSVGDPDSCSSNELAVFRSTGDDDGIDVEVGDGSAGVGSPVERLTDG